MSRIKAWKHVHVVVFTFMRNVVYIHVYVWARISSAVKLITCDLYTHRFAMNACDLMVQNTTENGSHFL